MFATQHSFPSEGCVTPCERLDRHGGIEALEKEKLVAGLAISGVCLTQGALCAVEPAAEDGIRSIISIDAAVSLIRCSRGALRR